MRILVVEDEVRLARAVQQGLQAEGFDVDVVHDGNEGFVMAEAHPYDAIVLDILLPGMNGYRVCAELRAAGNWTPILMLTAKDGEYDEAEAFETGADDYLSKPFSYVVLVARLRSLIRRGRAPRPELRRVGDLVLDPATRRCERDGTDIELTQREFSLLEALMRRAPEVAERHSLLDAVWGTDTDVDPNVLEVYIGYLRRKVDDPFDERMIQTVRGVGYRMVPGTGR
ncbi:MAG: response regulator transcription factor [Acidimicrobiia bacterium]|nr:response regulator transcription factor [Acidimicrobiia bacterium]